MILYQDVIHQMVKGVNPSQRQSLRTCLLCWNSVQWLCAEQLETAICTFYCSLWIYPNMANESWVIWFLSFFFFLIGELRGVFWPWTVASFSLSLNILRPKKYEYIQIYRTVIDNWKQHNTVTRFPAEQSLFLFSD